MICYYSILVLGASCTVPGFIANGNRQGNAPFECTSFVTYSCNLGFQLKGSAYLTCISNGRWNVKKPTCVPLGELFNYINWDQHGRSHVNWQILFKFQKKIFLPFFIQFPTN